MKPRVVARLTAIQENGMRLIVEVRNDADFNTFYHFYTQQGRRYSTKQRTRTANRNEGLRPHYRAAWMKPGLDVLAGYLKGKVKIRVFLKRTYRKLIESAPDVIGISRTVNPLPDRRLMPRPVLRYPFRLPSNHTTIAKKVSILTGRR